MSAGLPEERAEARLKVCNRIAGWVGSIILGFLVLSVLASFPVTARLMTGWQHHARELLPELGSRWRDILLAMVCFAGLVVLARIILGVTKEKGAARSWRTVHLIAVSALLLFGVAAAITGSRIVREFIWLGDTATLHEKRGYSHFTWVLNDGRQLADGIKAFKEAEGRYPETLEELEDSPHHKSGNRWQEGVTGSVRESYIYLKPAAGQTANGKVPLLISPVVVKDRKFAVFYQDGNGRAFRTEEMDAILAEAGLGTADE